MTGLFFCLTNPFCVPKDLFDAPTCLSDVQTSWSCVQTYEFCPSRVRLTIHLPGAYVHLPQPYLPVFSAGHWPGHFQDFFPGELLPCFSRCPCECCWL